MRYRGSLSCITLALAAGFALCAPPALDIPAEVRASGEYVRFSPKTDALGVTYIGLSGFDSFPSEELKDAKRFLFHTRGIPDGRYKFAAIASGATGEQTRLDFTVIVGNGIVPPPVPPAPPIPVPPAPNPIPSAVLTPPLFVLVVEETGVRTTATGKVLADGAMWLRLKAAGVNYTVFDRTDPAVTKLALDKLADATGLPAVIVRDSKGVDRAFKLPLTSGGLELTVKGLVSP